MNVLNTNPPRVALGIVAGALTGAILVTILVILMFGAPDLQSFRDFGFQNVAFVFGVSLLVWGTGLAFIAPWPWIILHVSGNRSWWIAVGLGAILTFVVVMGLMMYGLGLSSSGPFLPSDAGGATWIDNRLTSHGMAEAMLVALMVSPVGAIVGFVVWRTAYRRVPSSELTGANSVSGSSL